LAGLSGVVLVSFSLNAIHVIEFVGAVALIALSIIIFARVRESSAYPFTVHSVKATVVFAMDAVLGEPVGRLSREIEMSLRRNSPERIDKFVWLTDPPHVTEQYIRSRMDVHAKITTGKNHEITRAIEPGMKLSEFRKLEMLYVVPEEAKQFRRFRLIENFVLPNRFPEADEYYDITIYERAKTRLVRFEFDNLDLVSARFAIIRGKRAPIYHEADVERDGRRNNASIECEFRGLRVGDVLSFRWNWNLPKRVDTKGKSAPGPRA
jgi:hypothetical protein